MKGKIYRITSTMIIMSGACACFSSDISELDMVTTDCAHSSDTDKGCVDGRLLHIPSPDWRDQIVYFLMIDRFSDGNPDNNDQNVGVYDPNKESHYSGGDLQGIINNIHYIKNLGATSVWTTPHVANMWWDPKSNYGGYHGYWARNFKQVDDHYGTLDDYKNLSHALHANDMYLIQDVVVNHVGNFFSYEGEYNPNNPLDNFHLNEKAIPTKLPTQPPFDLADINNPEHRNANIYHWTPDIVDFSNKLQETTYQTSALSDLNTTNPKVIEALKDSFGFWVKETGVDAIRIDTVKYVEEKFYEDFLHGENGLDQTARETGRNAFYSFGEIYNTSLPFSDKGEKKLAQYISTDKNKKIDAPLGFPLYKEINRVFAGNSPTAYLSYRLKAQMREYHNPFLTANFIDNHDVERFLASGTLDGLRLAYALMMTIPGIPIIYQGDEQLFVEYRKSMFAGGYQSKKGHFNQKSKMYRFIQKLAAIRKSNKLFSRGNIEVLQDNPVRSGVFAYKREYNDKVGYVVLNNSNSPTLLNHLPTVFSRNAPEPNILMSENYKEDLNFDPHGFLTQVIPANSILILTGDKNTAAIADITSSDGVYFDSIQPAYIDKKTAHIKGHATMAGAKLLRIIDGDYNNATPLITNKNGKWEFSISTNDLGEENHFIEIYWPEKKIVSSRKNYLTRTTKAEYSVKKEDRKNDHNGISGKYTLPTHESIGCEMDIENAGVRAGGNVLELTLTMCQVSDIWQPPNQFDHVSFTIFFDVNPLTGMKGLPVINGKFPNQGKWDLAHVSYGWGNYIYNTDNASLQNEGTKLGVAPKIEVDKENNTIRFTYNGKELGVNDWKNTNIYITTWDKDGGGTYRSLLSESNVWDFGGGSGDSEKILDDFFVGLE